MKDHPDGATSARILVMRTDYVISDEARQRMSIAASSRAKRPLSKAPNLNIANAKRGERNPMFGTVSPTRKIFADKDEVFRLRMVEGYSLSRMAKHFGVCVTTVHNWLKVYGIKCSPEDTLRRKQAVVPWNYRGGQKESNGYVLIASPDHPAHGKDGYVMQHRLVLEGEIGRLLFPEERIHHLNHKRCDNSVQNLLLLPSDKAHTLFHHWVSRVGAYAMGNMSSPPAAFTCGSPVFYKGQWVTEIPCSDLKTLTRADLKEVG